MKARDVISHLEYGGLMLALALLRCHPRKEVTRRFADVHASG